MKLHILSDLHLEFSNLVVPKVDADVLVLAGDIGTGCSGVEFAKTLSERYAHVIYVMGNHEFYNQDLPSTKASIKQAAALTNIHVLDDETFHFQGVDFIGSTLWTDFSLYGSDPKLVGMCQSLAEQGMNDFRLIRYTSHRFTAYLSAQLCQKSQAFIASELASSTAERKVVVTHHCPSLKSVAKKYEGDLMNSAFANNLDHLIAGSDLWVHGHTHSQFDYVLNKARVVCNPRGYSRHQDRQENIQFALDKVVEL